jgi:hypothetical protein
MIRPSRLILGAALVIGAACSGTPTAPEPAPNTMTPDAGVLLDEPPSEECRGGFTVTNGKAC